MMYLVLVLVVTMVSRPHPEIRKLSSARHKRHPLISRHAPVLIPVYQAHHLLDHIILAVCRDVVRALMLEPVCCVYLLEVPVSIVVEIV